MVVNNFFKICLVFAFLIISSPVFADTYGEGLYGSERYSGNNSTTTVPSAPTPIIATAGNSQASISFIPPANNGGSTIIYYTVTSSPEGVAATGLTSPIVVTGLTNGTSYTFTIVAINSVGTSSPSAASNSITPAAPIVNTTPSNNSNYGGGGNTSMSPHDVLLSTPISTSTNQNNSPIFNSDLIFGMISSEIKDLQKFLNKNGFTISSSGPGSIGNETNKFGPATRAALIKFQKANNISPAIGYFGPITRALVNSILELDLNLKKPTDTQSTTAPLYTRDLDLNTLSDDVKALQQFLNKEGFLVSISGPGSIGNETNKFGPATKAALIKFQIANKISPAIGYFGPITRSVVINKSK